MNITGITSNRQATTETASEKEDKDLKKACRDFEGIMIQFMLKSMRNTLTGDCVFGNSMGKDIFQSMYDEQLAKDISSGENSIGIGDTLYRQLKTEGAVSSEDRERIEDTLKEPGPVAPGAAKRISEIV